MASIYDKQILSKADLERVNNLNEAWKAASDKKLKDGLHAQAEAIRNSYGYSGGEDGSQFILQNSGVLNTAAATKGYTDSLEGAKTAQAQSFLQQQGEIEKDRDARLRDAYIKNMQDSLGLSQQLKSAGISGGASESTVAYMNNIYNNNRNDIIEDALESKNELLTNAREALAKADAEIAGTEYDGSLKRADALKSAEQTAYERNLAEYDRNYQKTVDDRAYEYNKQKDERDFAYQKAMDERDFAYKKEQDAAAAKKAASSSSSGNSSGSSGTKLSVANVMSLIKEGVYNADFAEILGITDDQVRAMIEDYSSAEAKETAWELLSKGIYDDSFPEILGYSEDILLNYVNSILNGY